MKRTPLAAGGASKSKPTWSKTSWSFTTSAFFVSIQRLSFDDNQTFKRIGGLAMRVLIIDDSRDASYLLSMLVEHFGHDAKALTVPQVAVDIATDWKPELVLLDLAMPGMDGYRVARQLRERAGLNGAKIIALSGYQQDEEREKCAGIDGHILKPITASRLATLLDGQACR